jgi:hypothetical protein
MDIGDDGDVELNGMVFDPSGTDRLCLFYVTRPDTAGDDNTDAAAMTLLLDDD